MSKKDASPGKKGASPSKKGASPSKEGAFQKTPLTVITTNYTNP